MNRLTKLSIGLISAIILSLIFIPNISYGSTAKFKPLKGDTVIVVSSSAEIIFRDENIKIQPANGRNATVLTIPIELKTWDRLSVLLEMNEPSSSVWASLAAAYPGITLGGAYFRNDGSTGGTSYAFGEQRHQLRFDIIAPADNIYFIVLTNAGEVETQCTNISK